MYYNNPPPHTPNGLWYRAQLAIGTVHNQAAIVGSKGNASYFKGGTFRDGNGMSGSNGDHIAMIGVVAAPQVSQSFQFPLCVDVKVFWAVSNCVEIRIKRLYISPLKLREGVIRLQKKLSFIIGKILRINKG